MRIAIGNLLEEVVSVDFKDRCIAIEDRKGLVWINSEFVILKHPPMSELKHTLDITPPADKRLVEKKRSETSNALPVTGQAVSRMEEVIMTTIIRNVPSVTEPEK